MFKNLIPGILARGFLIFTKIIRRVFCRKKFIWYGNVTCSFYSHYTNCPRGGFRRRMQLEHSDA